MLEQFIQALDLHSLSEKDYHDGCLLKSIHFNTNGTVPSEGISLAILGIGTSDAEWDSSNNIRKELYKFLYSKQFGKIADFGNIKSGAKQSDTEAALKTVLQELHDLQINVLLLGNSEHYALQQYLALKPRSANLQFCCVTQKINLKTENVWQELILDEPNHLFNLSALAFQSYLSEEESLNAMEKMRFDLLRLGEIRENLQRAETYLRHADCCSFSLEAIKSSDFAAQNDASPNGLRSEEACQLARYAGLSTCIKSFGLYGYQAQFDYRNLGAKLAAQIAWHYIEGFFKRKAESPLKDQDSFLKYRIVMGKHETVFHKSKISNRWWLEIPHPNANKKNTFPILIPCLYEDYEEALKDELPERWLNMYSKYLS